MKQKKKPVTSAKQPMRGWNRCQYKLTIEYDGEYFFGFQRQTRKRTVQAELEKALKRLFRQKLKIASASGRTDAGVHAAKQVVGLKVDSRIPPHKMLLGLNTYLPEDIAVIQLEKAPAGFHARFWAKRKTYQYRVWNNRIRSPLRRRKTFHYPFDVNLALIQQAARYLLGRHDFKSFQSGESRAHTVRTLCALAIRRKGSEIIFTVTGDGFLQHMVRNLVGALLMVGRGRITPDELKKILRGRDRRHLGPTVPAHALTLVRVWYPELFEKK